MGKLFGNNQAFSAALEIQTADRSGNTIAMPGKISFDAGKSRFESTWPMCKANRCRPMPPCK